MSRFLFCCPSYRGHVDPLLKLVQELTARGAEVIFAVSDDFRETVEAAGAVFRSISPQVQGMPEKKATFFEIPLIGESQAILQRIVDTARTDRPDCLVYDSMCLWGMLLAKILNVPAIRIHGQFPINASFHPFNPYSPLHPVKEKNVEFDEDMQKLCRSYQLPLYDYHEVLYQAEPLNIVRFLREFFPVPEQFDERFQFVGPFMEPDHAPALFPVERVIYISLGTTGNNAIPAFYDICLSAFGQQLQQVVIATGNKLDYEVFGPLPENVTMRPYVQQRDVLKKADVFITHGGTNSIMEAISYGVPMLVVPLTLEQAVMAERIEELRLGRVIKNVAFITAHTMRRAVAQIKEDQEIHTALQNMRERARKSGGYALAVDLMMQAIT